MGNFPQYFPECLSGKPFPPYLDLEGSVWIYSCLPWIFFCFYQSCCLAHWWNYGQHVLHTGDQGHSVDAIFLKWPLCSIQFSSCCCPRTSPGALHPGHLSGRLCPAPCLWPDVFSRGHPVLLAGWVFSRQSTQATQATPHLSCFQSQCQNLIHSPGLPYLNYTQLGLKT